MENEKLKEMEQRIEKLEKKFQEYDKHVKTDIKGDMNYKEKLKELENKVNFIDKKVERRFN
ncbi:MAG: hypothetical protein ACOCQG_00735 [Candidatus Nanoarchaeia archaeon]